MIPDKFEFEVTTSTETLISIAVAVLVAGAFIAGFSAWVRTKF